MTAVQQGHPDPGQLTAYSVGRLDEGTAAEVASHLAGCLACRDRLAALPENDPLANLLRSLPPEVRRQAGTDADLPPELIGHPRYEVLGEIGRGGMGVVYKARHKLMDRPVAIKVIRRRLIARAGAVERFRGEVQTAAKLDHPNVVRVFDADQADGMHFLVMEHVEGIDLARLVQEGGPLPVARACEYARQAALGLQHAHEKGLVHRDVKPSNLMLTPGGQVKVLDFGLAGLLDRPPGEGTIREKEAVRQESSSVTELGRGLGTPDYVAPEQAVDVRLADVRSDIYSLGATLYFLLTGQPPFTEGSTSQRVLAHLVRTPRPLPEVRKDVPAGLVAVVNKMLAKDAGQRFQTPAEVGEALARFAFGVARGRMNRRQLLVGAGVAAGGLLVGGTVWLLLGKRSLALAAEVRRLEGHTGPVQAVAFSPDGRRVLSGSDDRSVRLWSMATGEQLRVLEGHQDWVLGVAFLPDRRHALSCGSDRTIRLWNLEAGGEVRRLEGHEGSVTCLAVSPDGTQALSGSDDQTVRLWSLQNGRELHRLVGHHGPVQCVAFSEDGRRALSGGNDRTLRLWDLVEGREVHRLDGHTHVIKDAVFCPDGRQALSGAYDGTTRLWNLESGQETGRQEIRPLRVFKVVAIADARLALAVNEADAVLWDVGKGIEVCRLVGHTAAVWAAAFSADGHRLLTGSVDRTVRLWDVP